MGDTGYTVGPWGLKLSNTVEMDACYSRAVVDDGEVDDIADLEVEGRTWEGAIDEESISHDCFVLIGCAPGNIDGEGDVTLVCATGRISKVAVCCNESKRRQSE